MSVFKRRPNPDQVSGFQLCGDGESDLFVRFEPVGPEYRLFGDDVLNVELSASDGVDTELELMYGENYVAIWFRPGVQARASNKVGEQLHFLA